MEQKVAAFWGATSPSTAQVDEMVTIARRAGEYMLGRMIDVAAYTGLRGEVELAKIQADHYDPDARLLYVPEGKAASHGPHAGKRRPRIVPVLGTAHGALLAAIDDWRDRSHEQTYPYEKLIFVRSAYGKWKPWTSQDLNRAYRPLREQVGAPERFHTLRHHFATYMLDRGVSELDVAVAMGHFDQSGRPNSDLVRTRYGHASHMKALDRIKERVAA